MSPVCSVHSTRLQREKNSTFFIKNGGVTHSNTCLSAQKPSKYCLKISVSLCTKQPRWCQSLLFICSWSWDVCFIRQCSTPHQVLLPWPWTLRFRWDVASTKMAQALYCHHPSNACKAWPWHSSVMSPHLSCQPKISLGPTKMDCYLLCHNNNYTSQTNNI